ncbi:MAG: GTP-binding protein [Promethearchaeota archaeon]
MISTAGIDAHPQSKERGITIDLGFTSLILDDYLITLVDGPGHADLIKISASSVEIIDIAMIVIDINKGPQVQTGEHIVMIEALEIKDIIVILNKIDLFDGNLEREIEKIEDFFKSTSYGSNISIYAVSAKQKKGFDVLKKGILKKINQLKIKRDIEGHIILPIDHHFSIKGRGAVLTGTLLKGTLSLNQKLTILPINEEGRVKSIQIFHNDLSSGKAGDRVGVNLKGIDINKVYRGCYATDDPKLFEYCDLVEIRVKKNRLFKPDIPFGTQVHSTIGMFTTSGFIYPYSEENGKLLETSISKETHDFSAFLWLNEKILFAKEKSRILLSRLDLPPTSLRILGAAKLIKIHSDPPKLYRIKIKRGKIQNPDHSQGIVCSGLAQSLIGAKMVIGKKLEPPFTKILSSFGTKGAVIIGIERNERSFTLKSKKDLNVQN